MQSIKSVNILLFPREQWNMVQNVGIKWIVHLESRKTINKDREERIYRVVERNQCMNINRYANMDSMWNHWMGEYI